jgi:ketosteroid isomerase-like protein
MTAMSQSNIELARLGFGTVAKGDLEALREILDPDVQWHGSEGSTRDSCHNREEALQLLSQAMRRGPVGELVEIIDVART